MVIRKPYPVLLAITAALVFASCGDDEPTVQGPVFDGMTIQEFPLGLGATWTYANVDAPEEQYRVAVVGTRIISGFIHWVANYEALDAAGNPTGEPPAPNDFYSANGLHMRLGALTRQPGVFARATFVGGTKAAAVSPFPVSVAFLRFSSPQDLEPLTDGQGLPIRYDEVTRGTQGLILEGASEGVLSGGSTNFQRHIPPRRFWQFPMRKGSRWTVFRTNELSKGTGLAPQPAILAERLVTDGAASVATPRYTGSAYVVNEWVTGLRKGADGNVIVPSLEDTDGDGVPQRGAPTARYWVAPGVGIVKYEYEFVDLGPPAKFTRKTYVLTAFTPPSQSSSSE